MSSRLKKSFRTAGIPTKIVPTPVQDKAYCGVCVRVKDTDREATKGIIKNMEYPGDVRVSVEWDSKTLQFCGAIKLTK